VSSTTSGPARESGALACALGGDDGRTLLPCAAPDFLEANRRQACEAVLLSATVENPYARPVARPLGSELPIDRVVAALDNGSHISGSGHAAIRALVRLAASDR
jgi:hypothetical protein